MIESEYTDMVNKLAKSGENILKTLTPWQVELWHMASAVGGEAGELFDAVKKHAIYCKELDIANIIEELGDIEFYLEGVRQLIDVSREECLKRNMDKLAKRYSGYQYSDKQAHERNDKA